MREWEIGAVENIHGALPYIRFAPILALVGVGLNRIGKPRPLGHYCGSTALIGRDCGLTKSTPWAPRSTPTSLADAFWNYINLAPTPPLYYLFMIGWTDAFGFSETVLRLPSAIIGIATIGVFWWGLNRNFDRQTSAVATILMALSWPALFYSQELRGYSAVLLFSTWAAVLAAGILKDFDGTPRSTWIVLLIASVLAAMTHPFGFIITGFLFLYLFAVALVRRRWVLRSFVMGALLLAAYMPWLLVNLTGIQWVLQDTLFSRPDL